MEQVYHTSRLIVKYWKNALSQEERKELHQWIAASEENRALFEELSQEPILKKEMREMEQYHPQQAWQRISGELLVKREVPWVKVILGVVLLLLAIVLKWWYTHR